MKKLLILVSAAAILALTGCNTINGVGKDVERAGEKVQNVAK